MRVLGFDNVATITKGKNIVLRWLDKTVVNHWWSLASNYFNASTGSLQTHGRPPRCVTDTNHLPSLPAAARILRYGLYIYDALGSKTMFQKQNRMFTADTNGENAWKSNPNGNTH